jgi:hypothetical protein
VDFTYQANPGEVWEKDEFWINLSWAIDPDGAMGIRQWFESPYRAGQKITVDEYYRWIFENSVPGLPEAAKKENLTPLEYMRKYAAFEVTTDVYKLNEKPLAPADVEGSAVGPNGVITKNGKPIGVALDGKVVTGYNTPSRKLELFSKTIADWKWPEFALPEYYRSHVLALPVTLPRAGRPMILIRNACRLSIGRKTPTAMCTPCGPSSACPR